MSWLSKLLPPRIKRDAAGTAATRKSVPEGLWSKCDACEAVAIVSGAPEALPWRPPRCSGSRSGGTP